MMKDYGALGGNSLGSSVQREGSANSGASWGKILRAATFAAGCSFLATLVLVVISAGREGTVLSQLDGRTTFQTTMLNDISYGGWLNTLNGPVEDGEGYSAGADPLLPGALPTSPTVGSLQGADFVADTPPFFAGVTGEAPISYYLPAAACKFAGCSFLNTQLPGSEPSPSSPDVRVATQDAPPVVDAAPLYLASQQPDEFPGVHLDSIDPFITAQVNDAFDHIPCNCPDDDNF